MSRIRALLVTLLAAALLAGIAVPAGASLTGGLTGAVGDLADDVSTDPLGGDLLGDGLLETTEALFGSLDDVFGVDDEYHDPFFLNWPTYLPAFADEVAESVERDCPNGSVKCVDRVIREMTRRWERMGCDHNAVFALTYLLTTEEYRRAVEDPHFFADNGHVNHQDEVFARLYFQPYDAWYEQGNRGPVPPAWRIAFEASDAHAVSGTGSILLGMNAHIRRDLPFVLAAIGMVAPDGTSRKADHDEVNLILNRVAPTIFEETSERYDPTIGHGQVDGTTIDNSLALQMVVEWREEAWRKAELLVNARSEEERVRIADMIERDATASAVLMYRAFAYDGLLTTTDARDSHCAAAHGG